MSLDGLELVFMGFDGPASKEESETGDLGQDP
jgi:hypothetical protein